MLLCHWLSTVYTDLRVALSWTCLKNHFLKDEFCCPTTNHKVALLQSYEQCSVFWAVKVWRGQQDWRYVIRVWVSFGSFWAHLDHLKLQHCGTVYHGRAGREGVLGLGLSKGPQVDKEKSTGFHAVDRQILQRMQQKADSLCPNMVVCEYRWKELRNYFGYSNKRIFFSDSLPAKNSEAIAIPSYSCQLEEATSWGGLSQPSQRLLAP